MGSTPQVKVLQDWNDSSVQHRETLDSFMDQVLDVAAQDISVVCLLSTFAVTLIPNGTVPISTWSFGCGCCERDTMFIYGCILKEDVKSSKPHLVERGSLLVDQTVILSPP